MATFSFHTMIKIWYTMDDDDDDVLRNHVLRWKWFLVILSFYFKSKTWYSLNGVLQNFIDKNISTMSSLSTSSMMYSAMHVFSLCVGWAVMNAVDVEHKSEEDRK